jgi:hypothetical protein
MKFFAFALTAGLAAAALPADVHGAPVRGRTVHSRAVPRRHVAPAAPATATAAAKPPAEGNVRPQDPASLVRALQAAGYQAKLGADKVGDPMITSGYSGTTFQIFFYNCTDHKNCATVTFHSGYDFNTPLPLETINEWNRSQRFGRAYLDKENDPILEMDLDLDDGGVAPLLFIDNMEFWTSVLGRFEKHIGYRK